MRSILNVRSPPFPADEVQRVRLERRLDEPGLDDGAPRRRFRGVAGGLVLELDDAPVRPGPGEPVDPLAERRIAGMLGEDVERPFDVRGERRGEDPLELLERRGEIGVVLVGVADHEPRRQDDGHGLVEGQLQRGEELVADDPPAATVGPDRDADLLLEGAQVPVHGPRRDPHPTRDLGRTDALGMAAQHGDDAEHPGEPVALAERALVVVPGHGAGG
jgi:hypothetical protein